MFFDNGLFPRCKFMLSMCGMGLYGNNTRLQHFIYKVFSIISQIIYVQCVVFFSVSAYLLGFDDIGQVLEGFSRMTYVILIVTKMILIQSKRMRDILLMLSREEENCLKAHSNLKKIYTFHVRYCWIIIFFVLIFLYAAGFINIEMGFMRYFEWKRIPNRNSSIPKPHTIPFWYPFDRDKHYFIAVSYQICHILQTLLINGSIQALVNSVLVFIRAQLKMLQYEIRWFDWSENEQKYMHGDYPRKNLRRLVIKHQEIIRWVNMFNDCFKTIFLLEYCITSLQLATTLIQIVQGSKLIFNLAFFTHCSLQLLALSWNANEILLESSIGFYRALFECPWYLHDKYCQYIISMMLLRCNIPLTMTIGPFGEMSIDMAISRLKLSYTCLSILQATTN
ncbi:uncharacterized protein LOC143196682 isoform X1 [Rhynchophorus ferrugineus]|uniref:uncharacterized protein LOC143196682 isoform X1 n=1 Tax=Rhynchophorus ferrugineus TaxID=354439 RepID=UPI003FCC9904